MDKCPSLTLASPAMCSEKLELEKRLNAAALRLSSALDAECICALHNESKIGQLQQLVKDAEQEWLIAKDAFGRHRQAHGC